MGKRVHYPVRTDKIQAGYFWFVRNNVLFCDDGVCGLKQFVNFDQGDFKKEDSNGTSKYIKKFEGATSRVYDSLTSMTLSGGVGTYFLRRRFRLPRDFGRSGPFPGDNVADPSKGKFLTNAISLYTWRSAAINSLVCTLWKGGSADSALNGVTISPAGATAWQQFQLTPADTYNPGDFLTLELEFTVTGSGPEVRFADYLITYLTDRGNV